MTEVTINVLSVGLTSGQEMVYKCNGDGLAVNGVEGLVVTFLVSTSADLVGYETSYEIIPRVIVVEENMGIFGLGLLTSPSTTIEQLFFIHLESRQILSVAVLRQYYST